MSINNTANTSSILSKVWAFCQTLRDEGLGYGNYCIIECNQVSNNDFDEFGLL